MSLTSPSLLAKIIIKPESALTLALTDWDLLIRQARRANVLTRLAVIFADLNILDSVPEQPRNHLQSSYVYSQRFTISLDREIQCIKQALQQLDIPIVFLKGAAYYLAGNLASQGRVFSDIDILVPEQSIGDVELALITAGWITNTFDVYDQKYYREWMHEIPPLRNLKRQSSIDVHHNILPRTCEFSPDANALLTHAINVPGTDNWVLAPEDRILHSAAHLFYGGEFEQGFRDLTDLHLLLQEFSVEESFWTRLLQRAVALKQQTSLHYALRYTRLILQTPMPAYVISGASTQSPGSIKQRWMDVLFLRALQPDHVSCSDRWTGTARWLLFVRSHWLKMPWYLLLPHLYRKTKLRLTGESRH
ncbi:MAG: nucleotidyltransferase family protein [Methylobacter sp.]|nr:nucleotidyltransferase family protein [Methylobacter sp.]